MQTRAEMKFARTSPQKARLVIDLIRGQRAAEALQILHFTKKRAARDIEKVLRSAIANAENNNGLKPETLRIKLAVAGAACDDEPARPMALPSAASVALTSAAERERFTSASRARCTTPSTMKRVARCKK